MCGGVEITIVVRRVIKHLNIAPRRGSPLDETHEDLGIRLENRQILVDLAKNGGADGEHQSGGIKPRIGQHMVNQPAMQPSVSVHKWVRINEPKCKSGSRHDRIEASL